MDQSREPSSHVPEAAVAEAWQQVGASFERFCLTAGLSALSQMIERGATQLCGPRYSHKDGKAGQRRGETQGEIAFHSGKVSLDRPRVRARDSEEMALPMGISAIGRPARPLGDEFDADQCLDLPVWPRGTPTGRRCSGIWRCRGVEVAVSRRFVALSAAQMQSRSQRTCRSCICCDPDRRHPYSERSGVAGRRRDRRRGVKHPLGVLEGATENAAVVQALLDNLVDRGLDPQVCRLFIIDGSKALREAIRRTFGKLTPIQRCQVHKGRNIMERLPKHLHASVRRCCARHRTR